MSAFLRALSRCIRLALHRHDPIECWCELSAADAGSTLPVQQGPMFCGVCWAAPGEVHQLSCPEVSPEQFRRFLGGGR